MRYNYIVGILLLCIVAANVYAWEGSGTSVDPYKISSPEDMIELMETSGENGNDYQGQYFVMTQDIDMAEVTDFASIGTRYHPFKGNFDGNDFEIQNLVVLRGGVNNNDIALFGGMLNGTVENVHITGASYFQGNKYVGSIIGFARSTIVRNCSSSAAVVGNTDESIFIGGLIGHAYSCVILNCYNTGMITATGAEAQNVGGLIGNLTNGSTLVSCYNLGLVFGTSNVGGVCGKVEHNDLIMKCYNKGIVTGLEQHAGGIIGYAVKQAGARGSVSECYNAGNITGKDYVGGLAGFAANLTHSCNIGHIQSSGHYAGGVAGAGYTYNCYNKGNVSGTIGVGGVIGGANEVNNCFNDAEVVGDEHIGGIAGEIPGTDNILSNSYNTGSISSTNENATSIGGVAGFFYTGGTVNTNKILNTYWNKDIYGKNGIGKLPNPGEAEGDFQYFAKTTDELKDADFPALLGAANWTLDLQDMNNGFPVLTGEVAALKPVASATFIITAETGENGSVVTEGKTETVEGSALLYRIVPEEGYEIEEVFVDGISVGIVAYYNFEAIEEDHHITATFKEIDYSSLHEQQVVMITRTLIDNLLEVNYADGYNLKITDISGRILLSRKKLSSNEIISMSAIPQGVYLVRLENGNNVKTYRIVKR